MPADLVADLGAWFQANPGPPTLQSLEALRNEAEVKQREFVEAGRAAILSEIERTKAARELWQGIIREVVAGNTAAAQSARDEFLRACAQQLESLQLTGLCVRNASGLENEVQELQTVVIDF